MQRAARCYGKTFGVVPTLIAVVSVVICGLWAGWAGVIFMSLLLVIGFGVEALYAVLYTYITNRIRRKHNPN